MDKPIDVRSVDGQLLFRLTPGGQIEIKKGDWIHRVDIAETMRTGKPVVSKAYAKAYDQGREILTNIDICGIIGSV